MGKFNNNIAVASGFKIVSGFPVDDRVIYEKLSDFEAMIAALSNEAPSLYEGAVIQFSYDVETGTELITTEYTWTESDFGILPVGYTYTGTYDVIAGIDYRGRTFNLVLKDISAVIKYDLASDTSEIAIPFKYVPYNALLRKVFTVKIIENPIFGEDVPSHITMNASSVLVHVYPAYVAGTKLTIKIS